MEQLTNRTAFVTGGSRGIGAAIVQRLAQEGAHVAFTYKSSEAQALALAEEARRYGTQIWPIRADSADVQGLKSAVDQAAATLGGLDILVNNAGIGVLKPLSELSMDEYEQSMAINTRAVFAATQAALAYLKEGGRVVNIGTCLIDRVSFPGCSLYSMSKGAVAGFTRALARELGPAGITVNLVNPGPIDTDMNPSDGPSSDAQRALLALREYGKPQDIAAMVAFLAGPGAAFVTGAELLVDGGTNI